MSETHKYDDIINMPHHVSRVHPQMDIMERAAQFSPFKALDGYGAAIEETARQTDSRIELDEYSREELDEKLLTVRERILERPAVSVTYFVPDEKKEGGAYITVNGKVKKIREFERVIELEDGTQVPINDVIDICVLG